MQICNKHNCAHEGVCAACTLQEYLAEVTYDLYSSRADLLDRERECARLQQELNHARGIIEKLESL